MRNQLPPGITKIELGSRENGRPRVRYQIVLDVGIVNGKRKQIRRRKTEDGQPISTESMARAEYAKLLSSVKTGSYIHKRGITVKEVVEQWLSGRSGLRPTAWTSHRDRLKPLVNLYGDLPLQDLKKHHIVTLMAKLEAGEVMKPNGKMCRPHNGQSRRNVLSSIKALMDSEVEQGHLARNVAQFVDTPALDSKEKRTLEIEQLQKLLAITADDRDSHLTHFFALGPRKSEGAGLMWQDIDMDAHSMKITRTRVLVDGKAVVGAPKTDRSNRELPIPDDFYSSLLHARAVQAREKLSAGRKYVDSGYVFVDELGQPVYPDYLATRLKDACKRAGIPEIDLHELRHTYAILMLENGEPVTRVSAWLGHANSAITLRVYASHIQPKMLDNAATAFTNILKNNVRKPA